MLNMIKVLNNIVNISKSYRSEPKAQVSECSKCSKPGESNTRPEDQNWPSKNCNLAHWIALEILVFSNKFYNVSC